MKLKNPKNHKKAANISQSQKRTLTKINIYQRSYLPSGSKEMSLPLGRNIYGECSCASLEKKLPTSHILEMSPVQGPGYVPHSCVLKQENFKDPEYHPCTIDLDRIE